MSVSRPVPQFTVPLTWLVPLERVAKVKTTHSARARNANTARTVTAGLLGGVFMPRQITEGEKPYHMSFV
ncbi:hypothetical protein GCM10022416_07090 [Actinomadura keratinilytica]|uniref:Uncharacterized protein n=1 Tax=Actinomadura keratinilytica TaxID=547461 RepID=A0ABP7Y3N2_9ACTN